MGFSAEQENDVGGTCLPAQFSGWNNDGQSGVTAGETAPVKPKRRLVERRPMTEDEVAAVAALQAVRYCPGSWDKRFASHIGSIATISAKEAPQVWRLFVRYRRQIDCQDKARLLRVAMDLSAPDLRKVAKMEREKAEVEKLRSKLSYG